MTIFIIVTIIFIMIKKNKKGGKKMEIKKNFRNFKKVIDKKQKI